jgi:hypothetical protein
MNEAYWLRTQMRNNERYYFTKRRKEFEANQKERATAVVASPRVKREPSVELTIKIEDDDEQE